MRSFDSDGGGGGDQLPARPRRRRPTDGRREPYLRDIGEGRDPAVDEPIDDLEVKFSDKRAALEAKYKKMYEPLYSKDIFSHGPASLPSRTSTHASENYYHVSKHPSILPTSTQRIFCSRYVQGQRVNNSPSLQQESMLVLFRNLSFPVKFKDLDSEHRCLL